MPVQRGIFETVRLSASVRRIEYPKDAKRGDENMWFNNGNNDCSCLWIILILILVCCCCGSGNSLWGGGGRYGCCCDRNCGCGSDTCC